MTRLIGGLTKQQKDTLCRIIHSDEDRTGTAEPSYQDITQRLGSRRRRDCIKTMYDCRDKTRERFVQCVVHLFECQLCGNSFMSIHRLFGGDWEFGHPCPHPNSQKPAPKRKASATGSAADGKEVASKVARIDDANVVGVRVPTCDNARGAADSIAVSGLSGPQCRASYSTIGDSGAEELGRALAASSTLTTLNLLNCGMAVDGAAHIAQHGESAASSRGARGQSMHVDVERAEERDQDSADKKPEGEAGDGMGASGAAEGGEGGGEGAAAAGCGGAVGGTPPPRGRQLCGASWRR